LCLKISDNSKQDLSEAKPMTKQTNVASMYCSARYNVPLQKQRHQQPISEDLQVNLEQYDSNIDETLSGYTLPWPSIHSSTIHPSLDKPRPALGTL
jgi:hypothetical protein